MTPKRQAEELAWATVYAQIADIHGVLFGDIEHPERPGIFERIRVLEGYAARVNRVIWLAVGSIIASLVALAFNIFNVSPPG